jgi:hypothetical protein
MKTRGTKQDRGRHSDMLKVTKALIAGMRKYANSLEAQCERIMNGVQIDGPLGCSSGDTQISDLEIIDNATTTIRNDEDTGTAQDIVNGERITDGLKFRIKIWDDLSCDNCDEWVEKDFRNLFDIPFHTESGLLMHIFDELMPYLKPLTFVHEKTGKEYTEEEMDNAVRAYYYHEGR